MKTQYWTDLELREAITGKEAVRNRALQYIFHQSGWKNWVVGYVARQGGNEQDVDDVFQETLIAFDRNLRERKFEGDSVLRTYFFGIAKRVWWKHSAKRKPVQEIVPQTDGEEVASVEIIFLGEEKKQLLSVLMGQAGERCKRIFQLVQLDYKMEEIAREIQLSSAAMAKKEHYRCHERLRKYLKENPEWKNVLSN